MSKDERFVDHLPPGVRAGLATTSRTAEKVLREPPTMEHVLLLAFLVTGIYMFIGSFDFSPRAAEFPRVMSGATILLSSLILLRNYLPVIGPLMVGGLGAYSLITGAMAFLEDGTGLFRIAAGIVLLVPVVAFRSWFLETVEGFVAEPMQVLGAGEIEDKASEVEQAAIEEDLDDDETDVTKGALYVYEIDDWRGPVVTALLCTAYMIVGFIIGLLYTTPIFVAAWAWWAKMERTRAVGLVLLSFLTAWGFYEFVTNDVGEGWLTGWQPPTPTEAIGLWFAHGEMFLVLVVP